MGVVVQVPRGVAERKPRHGQPCNRCGACCMATLCPLARKVFGFEFGRCPALVWSPENPESSCGLVVEPAKHAWRIAATYGPQAAGDAAKLLVGSGIGCDARINGEPGDEEFYRQLRLWDRENQGAVRRARKVWGV